MVHVITAIVAILLIMGGTLALVNSSLISAGDISASLDDRTDRSGNYARAELTLIQADIVGSDTDIDISIQNTGQTILRDFSKWDLMITYYDTINNSGLNITRMAYTTSSTPSNGQWTVEGIYTDNTLVDSEVYEPNTFNPGEAIKLRLNIDPAIPTSTDNTVAIVVENGARLEASFSR